MAVATAVATAVLEAWAEPPAHNIGAGVNKGNEVITQASFLTKYSVYSISKVSVLAVSAGLGARLMWLCSRLYMHSCCVSPLEAVAEACALATATLTLVVKLEAFAAAVA